MIVFLKCTFLHSWRHWRYKLLRISSSGGIAIYSGKCFKCERTWISVA